MIGRAFVLSLFALAACTGTTEAPPPQEAAAETTQFAKIERRGYAENALFGFADAERAYRETSLIARDRFAGDPAAQAEQAVHLALNKSNIGEYQLAEALFAKARPVLESRGSPAMSVKPALFYAQHEMNLGKPADALDQAQQAESRATRALEGAAEVDARDPNAPRVRTFTITDQDSALLRTGGARATSAVAGVVLTEREKLYVLRAHARYVEAKALEALGRSGGADLLEEAQADLDQAPKATVIWLRAAILLARADVAETGGDLPRAIALTGEAVAATRQFAANQRPEALARLALARRLAAAGRDGDARSEYGRAVAVLTQGRQGVRYEEIAPYVALLEDAANGGDAQAQADVFLAMQQVRSPVTARTLAQVTARLTAGDSEAARAIRSFQDAQRNVNRYAARIDLLESAETVDVHSLNIARDQFRQAQVAAAEAQSALDDAAPNYDQLVDSSVSLADVQAALRDGAAFAQIALGEHKGAVALVDASGLKIHTTRIGMTEAKDLVDRIRAGVDGGAPGQFDLAASKAAFDALFGPVRDEVLASASLVVAPTGPFLSLPFGLLTPDAADSDVLWTAAGGSYDYRSVNWLGIGRPITTAVSASSFALLDEAGGSDADIPFRGYGDFVEYGSRRAPEIVARRDLPSDCVALYRAIGRIGALPSTGEEIAAVAEALGVGPSALVTGKAFTDQAIVRNPPTDVRILHFATHGLLPLDVECLPEPALVTSLDGPQSDALLDAGEIADLKLNADLVVLSACDTGGQGALTGAGTGFRFNAGGEALSGLVRAFFFAGARNVVASHWSVPDVATQILMVGFYQGLADGETVAGALRKAQAALEETQIGSHPFYWAAFSAIGDGARRLREGGEPAEAPAGRPESG